MIAISRSHARSSLRRLRRFQMGFNLVELSIVLVVIGVIIGAASVVSGVQRNASYQRIQIAFVQGWQRAYQNYFDQNGIVIGDNAATPSLQVNNSTTAMCGTPLIRIMQAAGIPTPQGRAVGAEDRYVYLDSNGNPQEVQVCFQNISWSIPDGVGGYTVRAKNAMVLSSITPDLARFLDTQIDARSDARFGLFRENSQAASTAGASQAWSIDSRMAHGSTTATNQDESQVAVVAGVYLMNQ